jgi:hypothetical protein
VYVFSTSSFKEHGILARGEKIHIFQPEQIMKTALKKFAVLGYTPEKLECFFKVQAKRT